MVKDVLTVAAFIATIPFGIEWLVGGQVIAAAVCFIYSQWLVARTTGYRVAAMLMEIAPYAAIALICTAPAVAVDYCVPQLHPVAMIGAQTVVFAAPYVAINAMLHSRIQHDVLSYALGRFTRKKSD